MPINRMKFQLKNKKSPGIYTKALPAVALHFFFRLERSEDTTAGRARKIPPAIINISP